MAELKPLLILYLSEEGARLAEVLEDFFPEAEKHPFDRELLARRWSEVRGVVFIGACGVAVRAVAPLLRDKYSDPAVVVVDERGNFVVSLLSGHLGRANDLAREVAALLGAQPVITTASDLAGLPAIDLWAEELSLYLEPREILPAVTTRYLKERRLRIYLEVEVPFPEIWQRVEAPEEADLVVSYRMFSNRKGQLLARPRRLVLGLGFHQGIPKEELASGVREVLEEGGLALRAVRAVATLDRKLAEEGLRNLAQSQGWELLGFPAEELNQALETFGLRPTAAGRHTEALAVAEPAALLASRGGRLLIPLTRKGSLTVAVAEALPPRGRLSVVGIGPGALEDLTPRARRALREATCVVGYRTYLELVAPLIQNKEIHGFGMTQEVERVRLALELAKQGRRVALVSGGDPGIYGMAGLVLEILEAESPPNPPDIEIIPGLTAASVCAARLGAPLMHDFACISLSDRLTPWELIEDRLHAAARADFVIVLYNPASRSRRDHIHRAREILLKYRPETTPVGLARAVGRPEETVVITTLRDMLSFPIDMQTTVLVGNSQSFRWLNYLITPRGYRGRRYRV